METGIAIFFLALCVSAPWIARRWRFGGIAWGIISALFLLGTIWLMH